MLSTNRRMGDVRYLALLPPAAIFPGVRTAPYVDGDVGQSEVAFQQGEQSTECWACSVRSNLLSAGHAQCGVL